MPVGISSPARNLFLLGSTGEQTVTNFFKAVDLSASTDGVFLPETLKYRYDDDSYTIGGTASDPQSKRFGWLENRTYNPDTAASTQVWDDRIESSVPGQSVFLRSIIFDQAGRIIAVGHGGGTCWIRRYSSAGVLDWQASTFTGEARYLGVAHDGVAYYVCGHTGPGDDDSAIAYVEKFDDQGNPIWGKAAFFEYDDVLLESIAIADDGNILAVGRIDDNDGQKGFVVKLDSQTGDVLWDKTITSPKKFNQFLSLKESVGLEKIYTDGNGQFYVVGRIQSLRSGTLAFRGTLIKFDTEGNIIWQKETPLDATKSIEFFDVSAETDTEQVIVLGRYYDGTANDEMGILSKYTKNGTLLWRRIIKSSRETSDTFSTSINPPALDADSSFYYLLFRDETIDTLAGEPDRYTFGKVSTSGNGLGDFQYADSTGETIDYEIVNIDSKVGVLQDGSVTNSVSDLRSTPYSAEKIVFDDYATNIAGKKRKVSEGLQSFMYSGSPAVRPQDFQELNLLGESIVVGPELITNGDFSNGTTGWSNNATEILTVSGGGVASVDRNGGSSRGQCYQTIATEVGKTYTVSVLVNAISDGFQVYACSVGDATTNLMRKGATNSTGLQYWSFTATTTSTRLDFSAVQNSLGTASFDNISAKEYTWLDGSGKGNNGGVFGNVTHNSGGEYWEFDETNYELIAGPKCNELFEDGGSGTIEMWVRPNNVALRQTLCSGYLSSGPTQADRWDFEIRNTGRVSGGFHDNGFITGTTDLNANEWYHFAFVLDQEASAFGQLKIYVNGIEDQSVNQTASRDFATDVEFGIGNRFSQQEDFPLDADVGEVRTYRRALSATQVFQNYNATKEKYTGVRANTTPRLNAGPIVVDSNLLLNYDFGNGSCIDTSSTVSTSTYETIIDDATTNGAAYGDAECVAVGYGKVVVGARGETNGVYTGGGKAYIYNASTGALEVTLTPSDISGNDWNFGNAVDICGCSGKIAVTSNSALYLYDADGTNEIIIDSNSTLPISPPGGNTFGNTVAISGNRVWVSDDNVPTGPNYNGTVYCFNVETGALLYELRPNDIFGNFLRFGTRIAAGSGKLAIGADTLTHPVTGRSNTGRVYLYDVNGTNEKIIEPDALTTSALFGQGGLAIDHGMLIVGASRQQRVENPLELGSGEVYVFDLKGELKFSIRPSDDPADEDADAMGFGDSVAISSDRIIVGAQYYVGNPGGVAGRAYQFTHTGKELQAWTGGGTGANASNFGSSMDASGGTLVIGASAGSPDASGRAYIYPLTNTPSGTIKNLVGTSIDGTVNLAPFNSGGWFEFDGGPNSGTRIAFDSSTIDLSGSFSIDMWFRQGAQTADYWMLLGAQGYGDPGSNGIGHYLFADTIRTWAQDTSGSNTTVNLWDSDGTVNFTAGVWYNLILTREVGTAWRWYLNGSLVNSNTTTFLSVDFTTPNTYIGDHYNDTSWQYDGDIAELRMYSRALTAAESLQNFNATRGKYGV